MGSRNPPETPSSGKSPGDPVKKTTEECKKCWTADYTKEISTASYGRYSQPYKKDGSPHSYSDKVEYKIYAPIKTGTEITVEVRFKVERKSGVTATQEADAKKKLEKGIKDHWDNKFTLEVDDPKCGKKTFKIRYKAVWVASGQHYTMKVHQTYAREGVTGDVLNVSKTTDAWTYAHEFAHCFGLPDEYSYTADTETVKYYKPDGTLGPAITAPPGGKSKTATDATIMSAVNNTKTLKRHAWYLAIEVRDLLKAKLGRAVKCDIK